MKIKKSLTDLFAPVYIPLIKELLYNKAEVRHVILKGGRISAKGTTAYTIMAMKLAEKKCAAYVYAPTKEQVKETSFKQVQEVLVELGLKFKALQSDVTITLANGSVIIFKGMEATNNKKDDSFFKGITDLLTIEYVIFDELVALANESQKRLSTIVKTFQRKLSVTFMYIFNPPDDLTHWSFDFAENMKGTARTVVLHTTVFDLPREWFTEEFFAEIERDKQLSLDDYNHEWLGLPTGQNTLAFPIKYSQLLTGPKSPNRFKEFFIVVDNGQKDATTFGLFGITYNQKMEFIHLYYHSGRDSNNIKADSEYAKDLVEFLFYECGHRKTIDVSGVYSDSLNFIHEFKNALKDKFDITDENDMQRVIEEVGLKDASNIKGKRRDMAYSRLWDLMKNGQFKVWELSGNKMLIKQIRNAKKDYNNNGNRQVAKVHNEITAEAQQIHCVDICLYAALLKYEKVKEE